MQVRPATSLQARFFSSNESEFDPERFDGPNPLRAYCVADTYQFRRLTLFLQELGYKTHVLDGVLHVRYLKDPTIVNVSSDGSPRDLFVFRDGGIVCWGTTPLEEKHWLTEFRPFQQGSLNEPVTEHMNYYLTRDDNEDSDLIQDCIVLGGGLSGAALTTNQLAFSYGMMRSMRLDVVESMMDKLETRIQHLPTDLAAGRFPNNKECLSVSGELLRIRGILTLESELLETPELYWEHPHLERLFEMMESNLDTAHRISILNQQLDYAHQVTETARSFMNEHSSTRLEQAIVVLIALEIALALLDKSERWEEFSWESWLGIDGHGSSNHTEERVLK
eukprot:CAMPEP_0177652778 /NCGR_PEP_ID=MMETSP0447-20121125/13331_1 /TAXON_ID=0 /ORGANISM="Stygamoeba regulata, Strain BSH-02190019" /LENGTH=334 /DNA_ID=CAMNT_0019156085 /DNA_START=448 /DNA_END=1452 /DNA_ORIENTATION=+